MDVLNVGGKEYIKASVIARELGYTADYVGQLCRGRKVNAKLVGRSWYVDADSIQSHKSTRYRSTQATSTKELKEELAKRPFERKVIVAPSNFYAHNKPEPKISYETDQSDLIPAVKRVDLPVELADAQAVSVDSKGSQYHFVTPKVPVIKFKGTLQVTDYEPSAEEATPGDADNDDNSRHIHPSVSKDESKKKAKNIVISSNENTLVAKAEKEHHVASVPVKPSVATSGAAPVAKPASFEARLAQATPTHVEVDGAEDAPQGINKLFLLGSATFALLVVLVCMGLQTNILIENQVAVTTYSFGLQHFNLSASSYDAFESFKGTLYLMKFSTNFFIF